MITIRLPDCQLTPSQWGAGGGSATHKEPTQAPDEWTARPQKEDDDFIYFSMDDNAKLDIGEN
jgi:hypothetical protein